MIGRVLQARQTKQIFIQLKGGLLYLRRKKRKIVRDRLTELSELEIANGFIKRFIKSATKKIFTKQWMTKQDGEKFKVEKSSFVSLLLHVNIEIEIEIEIEIDRLLFCFLLQTK